MFNHTVTELESNCAGGNMGFLFQFVLSLLLWVTFPSYSFAGVLGENITPYVGASSTYHTNLFLLSENENISGIDQKSDILVRTDLGLIADIPINKQRIFADLNINFNQYQEYDFLDHIGAKTKIRWDWEVGEQWSGEVGYNYDRYLTSFENYRLPIKDLTDKHNVYGEFGYHFHPSWEIAGGVSYYDLTHSQESRSFSNKQIIVYNGEIRYLNEAKNFLGYELTVLDGEFNDRNASQVDRFGKSYIQYRTGLTANWRLTGKSKVLGRLGYTFHESDAESKRDFSGISWLLDYRWEITGKSKLKLATWRAIRPVDDPIASFVEETGVSFSPTWEVTSKIKFSGEFSYINKDYAGDPGNRFGLVERLEDFYTIEVGVDYRPLRQILLELVYKYENRESTRELSDFFYHTISGGIRIDF